MLGWCGGPCSSYITYDLIFPHEHYNLSVRAWPSVCIHSGFKYRFQQYYHIIPPHHTHTDRHPPSTHYPHTLIPNPPPRSIKKFQVTKLWRRGYHGILLFPLAEDYTGWQGGDLSLIRTVAKGQTWLTESTLYAHKHEYCKHTRGLILLTISLILLSLSFFKGYIWLITT